MAAQFQSLLNSYGIDVIDKNTTLLQVQNLWNWKALENVIESLVGGLFLFKVNVLNTYQEVTNSIMKQYDLYPDMSYHLFLRGCCYW